MKRIFIVAVLMTLSFIGYSLPSIANTSAQVQLEGQCSQRMGPYHSQQEAERAAQAYRNRGYQTSSVWGEGGLYSGWQNRRYYFNLFYPC